LNEYKYKKTYEQVVERGDADKKQTKLAWKNLGEKRRFTMRVDVHCRSPQGV